MDLLVEVSVRDVARRLGVSPHRVRALIAADELHAIKVGRDFAVSSLDVDRIDGRLLPGRRWSAAHVWRILQSEDPPDVSLAELAARSAGRAERHLLYAHPSMLAALVADDRVLLSGDSMARCGLGGPEVEGYVAESQLQAVVDDHAMQPAERVANVVLRAVADGAELPDVAPDLLVAVDLLDSLLPRLRARGAEMIEAQR